MSYGSLVERMRRTIAMAESVRASSSSDKSDEDNGELHVE
jgi:hypothetical protein